MVEVRTSTPNLDRIEKEMDYLSKHGVKVGVLGDDTNSEGVKVKEYATYLILGTQFMPPRDFMDAVRGRNQRLDITRYQRQCLVKVFRGEITGKQCLNQIGIYCVQKLKARILEGKFAPNKEKTIKYKTRNKHNILRDSDTLLNSLAHEVIRL